MTKGIKYYIIRTQNETVASGKMKPRYFLASAIERFFHALFLPKGFDLTEKKRKML